jgi:hypothetical protein
MHKGGATPVRPSSLFFRSRSPATSWCALPLECHRTPTLAVPRTKTASSRMRARAICATRARWMRLAVTHLFMHAGDAATRQVTTPTPQNSTTGVRMPSPPASMPAASLALHTPSRLVVLTSLAHSLPVHHDGAARVGRWPSSSPTSPSATCTPGVIECILTLSLVLKACTSPA